MKRHLWLKYLAAYLLFCVLSFVTVSTFTLLLFRNRQIKIDTENMYEEATRLASSPLVKSYTKEGDTLASIQEYFSFIANYENSTLWLMDMNGNIVCNTSQNEASSTRIDGFDPTKLLGNYYQEGTFFDFFPFDVLSVVAPISTDYDTIGYVAIHYSMSKIDAESYSLLNVSYVSLAAVLLLSLILPLSFYWLVYRPIRKLLRVADEYAAGNFNYVEKFHFHDEISYIGASLQYMAGEINQSGESQRKFISNISHDLRSPLTSIKGYVEAILDGTIPPEMQEKYLKIVLDETSRLNKLTQGLLTLNNFDDKGTLLEITTFDINEVIKKTAATFQGLCDQKGLTFSLTFEEPVQNVRGDMGKIQQVLYNLIDNAIKFSFPDSQIYIETLRKHEKVFVSVKDTGEGIPKDSIKKIWKRFYKTDPSRGKDKKGTGLGLSITKEIIQAHGENINVVSTENVGTEFTFTLPAVDE